MSLEAALRRLEHDTDKRRKVYAIEQPSGARVFTLMTPDEAWKRTASSTPSPSHIYEVLSSTCNMYLDIEWKSKDMPLRIDEESHVKRIVSRLTSALDTQYNEKNPAVTSVTASGMSSTLQCYKCSWHVHVACSGVCWANAAAVGQFVKSVFAHEPLVDKVPYAYCGQNWRCVGSAKYNEPSRRFLPADRSTFLNCTIQQSQGHRKVIYPTVGLEQSVSLLPVPAHIRDLAALLDSSTTPVMCSPSTCVLPFRKRQYCEHVGRKHRSNHQYAVIDVNTLMWKMKCHACPDASGCWQPFSDVAKVQDIVAKHHLPLHQASVLEPLQRDDTATACGPATFDLHTVGPPPATLTGACVRCRDGTYLPA